MTKLKTIFYHDHCGFVKGPDTILDREPRVCLYIIAIVVCPNPHRKIPA